VANRTKRTPKKEDEIIEAIVRHGGNVTRACEECLIGRTTLFEWCQADATLKGRVADAVDKGTDVLEEEARRRAFEGCIEPVFYQGKLVVDAEGKPVGVRKYSDFLMGLLLKGHRSKYRESKHEITGPGGQPLNSNVHIYLPDNGRDDKKPTDDKPGTGGAAKSHGDKRKRKH
jgi:hypothetical protein